MRVMSKVKIGNLEAKVISTLPPVNLDEFVQLSGDSEPEGPRKILIRNKSEEIKEFLSFSEFLLFANNNVDNLINEISSGLEDFCDFVCMYVKCGSVVAFDFRSEHLWKDYGITVDSLSEPALINSEIQFFSAKMDGGTSTIITLFLLSINLLSGDIKISELSKHEPIS